MAECILVLNAGSSSIKFEVFDCEQEQLSRRYEGLIDGIGTQPVFKAKDAQGNLIHENRWEVGPAGTNHNEALARLSAWLDPLLDEAGLLGVGHRVVHGGALYSAPVVITAEVLSDLEALTVLAPLHQPHNIAGIRAAQEFLPGVPNVACFDTAFHRSQPLVADQFALPQEFYDEGVRRYGFHGLSYEYVVRTLPTVAPELVDGRLIVAHLGNGASMCAIRGGRSQDSTMGFTALDGLPMGTRCGSIDPGVLLYLLEEKDMDAKQIENLLYKQSGLLGLSGISNDMRQLLASDNPCAAQAVDYFVYHIVRQTGALAAAIGGIDALIFTAGIGENATEIRARVCRHLAWLGIELNQDANERHEPCISLPDSRVSAWVIPTDEERMIALHIINALV